MIHLNLQFGICVMNFQLVLCVGELHAFDNLHVMGIDHFEKVCDDLHIIQ